MKDAIATLKLLPPEQWTAQYYVIQGYSLPPLSAFPSPVRQMPPNVLCYCATGWLLDQAGVDLNQPLVFSAASTLFDTYGLNGEQAVGLQIINDDFGLAAAIAWLERNYIPPEAAA